MSGGHFGYSDAERREVARRLREAKRPSLIVLMDVLGVEDFRPYMDACERRNRERGRIAK